MHHLVIGTGPAGVVAAETLRKLDPDSTITLLGNEPEAPYSRMAIPYYLINNIRSEGTHLRKDSEHFASLRIDLRQGCVERIDTASQRAILQDASEIPYDRLLLATGSTPTRPPIEGMDLPGVHSCWTLEDARAIIAGAQQGSRVVLMGAGFIGCIILEALARRGVDLTVVEMENRMVPRMMNEHTGGLIKTWCEQQGVRVLTSTRVNGITRAGAEDGLVGMTQRIVAGQARTDDGALRVALNSHDDIIADLVICATGVKPNVRCAAGLDTDHGILVNEYLESSATHVYAAGDCCQGRDFSTGQYSVQAIQPTAAEHARVAATNMVAARSHKHRGCLNMNVLDTMGLISASMGAWEGVEGGDTALVRDDARFKYLELQFADDVLVGANSLGFTQHVGVLRGLIQTQTPLGAWKDTLMRDPTRIMEAYLACAQPAVARSPA